jgi:hypothetical protein
MTLRSDAPRPALRRASGVVTSVAAGAAALLVPKCPLCVAAMLAALGVGTSAASALAPLVRPIAFLLLASVVVGVAVTTWRRRAEGEAVPRDCACSAALGDGTPAAPGDD